MAGSETWLLRGLLGLILLLPVWISGMTDKCTALHTVKDQLNSTLRRRYMKNNFPINYTIQVRYEEVFRLHNISRLMHDEDPVNMTDLQELWLEVAQRGIKRILRVLPERHPTRKRYLTELENLFRIYRQRYANPESLEETDLPDSIVNIWERLGSDQDQGWRSVTPKSLLDNCYRTMHCLFKECFSKNGNSYDYCDVHHWRKMKATTPQPT